MSPSQQSRILYQDKQASLTLHLNSFLNEPRVLPRSTATMQPKIATVVTATLMIASAITPALAGNATINNLCNFNLYLRPSGSSTVTTLAPSTGTYSQPISGSGNTIFFGTDPTLPTP